MLLEFKSHAICDNLTVNNNVLMIPLLLINFPDPVAAWIAYCTVEGCTFDKDDCKSLDYGNSRIFEGPALANRIC